MERPGQPAEPLRENNQLELEIGEDGSLRLFCSRATDTLDGHQVVMEIVIAGLIRRILEAAMAVGAATGFGGTWEVGVEVGDLAGAISYFRVQHWFNDAADMPRYPQNIYRRTWTGPLSETTVNEALRGLFGPLNRTLTDGKFVPPVPA
jgi:hypothetical protein